MSLHLCRTNSIKTQTVWAGGISRGWRSRDHGAQSRITRTWCSVSSTIESTSSMRHETPQKWQSSLKSWVGGLNVVVFHYKTRFFIRYSHVCEARLPIQSFLLYVLLHTIILYPYYNPTQKTVRSSNPSSCDFMANPSSGPRDMYPIAFHRKWWFHMTSLFFLLYWVTRTWKTPT
jgi:hypothetical protein